MKLFYTLVIGLTTSVASFGQVVSNVEWKLEGSDKIIITYDLEQEENFIYFNVSVKMSIDQKSISPKALSGDVGKYIKVGVGKKIIWDIFQDISELNGQLAVEVIASNPVPSTTTNATTKDPDMRLPSNSNTPFWVGMGSLAATGVGILMKGLNTNAEGMDLYAIYKDNRSESATIYSEIGMTRQQVYDDANKKHKTGTFLAAAGGVALAFAGYIMVNRLLQNRKSASQKITFVPELNFQQKDAYGRGGTQAGLTLKYRFR